MDSYVLPKNFLCILSGSAANVPSITLTSPLIYMFNMDNTIHSQSTVTQNLSPCTEESKSNCVSMTGIHETHKNFANTHPVNSNIVNGDSVDKGEVAIDKGGGNVFKIVSEEGSKNSDVKSAVEDKPYSTVGSVEMETSEDSGPSVELASEALPEGSLPQTGENANEGEDVSAEKEEWMDILGSGQLKKKVLRPGSSSFRPSRSWLCQVNYEARLPDGKVVEECKNLNFQIGDGEVIEGLDLVLPLMDVGELAEVEVAARFAYNSLGLAPHIPPGATLTYTVELLSAEPEPELDTIPVAERKRIGNAKRTCGNKWYERQKYTLAIQCYRRALEYLDEIVDEMGNVQELESDADVHGLLADRLKVYNNMAAAQMKIEAYDAALTSVGNVLLCQPDNVKALYRKGKILRGMGNNSEARAVLVKASSLDPGSKIIQKELQTVSQVCRVEARKEKDLYKKMFTKESSPAQSNTTSRQIPWGAIVGSVSAAAVAVIATLAAYKYKFM